MIADPPTSFNEQAAGQVRNKPRQSNHVTLGDVVCVVKAIIVLVFIALPVVLQHRYDANKHTDADTGDKIAVTPHTGAAAKMSTR